MTNALAPTNPWITAAINVMQVAAQPRDQPVKLAAGGETDVYLDVKGVLVDRFRMKVAAEAMLVHIHRYRPTTIGGPTMGADVLSQPMVMVNHKLDNLTWFSVRSARKTTHGLGLWIEGHRVGPGDRVVIMDDVASSGKSLLDAWDHINEAGAETVAICPFVDRAGKAEALLRESGYEGPYAPLMTYEDLGLAAL
ncbi:hypothetical protein JRC04_04660 [Mycolicibacterium sp. S2-37]|uniref:phosphoribosyltransferase family protein n=1 Tax=Mycolicibacterium sp. S2-37 TaxID=2810297 RepID=UPI001A950EDA|nr:phosphoribosyltransferase family protein [Mycolicibacterium sp. S2-37]MBO0676750.1 hypothetical protein [Mycolicibacterium sp. S2-37]